MSLKPISGSFPTLLRRCADPVTGPRLPEDVPSARPRTVRWIPPLTLPGALQMAIDALLLEAAVADPDGAPVLRLYRWSRPTLSLGFHQRSLPPLWRSLRDAGAIELVRRPSGGRAVLHGGDLTYALIWPAAASAGSRHQTHALACRWLLEAFAAMDLPLRFGEAAPSRDRASCFATSTSADLIHGDGRKRIGSAQLWSRGCLLQHGSVLLAPDSALWSRLFGEPPPPLEPLPLRGSELEALLQRCAATHLPFAAEGCALEERSLCPQEWSAAEVMRARFRLQGDDLLD